MKLNKTIVLILLLVNLSFGLAQKNVDSIIKGDIKEIFEYKTEEKLVKHGKYECYYKKLKQVEGNYRNDKKHGKWIYQNDETFKIIAFYNLGEKDSIWKYIEKGNLVALINYSVYNKFMNNEYVNDTTKKYYKKSVFNNGKIKSEIYFQHEIKYKKIYSENGDILLNHIFIYDTPSNLYKDSNYLSKEYVKEGNGTLIKKTKFKGGDFGVFEKMQYKNGNPHGSYISFYDSGDTSVKGQYKGGYMIGKWKSYSKSATNDIKKTIEYTLKDSIAKDTNFYIGHQTAYMGNGLVIVDRLPVFFKQNFLERIFNGSSSSKERFRNYIVKNLVYNKYCRARNIEGKVYVQFVVNQVGRVTDVVVFKGAHPLLNTEAVNTVKNSPYWIPGIQDGLPVSVKYTFPISFVLK